MPLASLPKRVCRLLPQSNHPSLPYVNVLAGSPAPPLLSENPADRAVKLSEYCRDIIETTYKEALDEARQVGLILIGGQALSIWAKYYLLDEMTGQEILMSTSDDVDFYAAGNESIDFLERKLEEKFKRATLDDATPNIAITQFDYDGEVVTVDVLGGVAGVERHHLADGLLTVSPFESGVEVLLIDPLCCLRSRLYNLFAYFTRNKERECIRVELAIRACKLFLQELYEDEQFEGIRQKLKDIKKIAKSDEGMKAYLDYGIDILRALPSPDYLRNTPSYKEQFLPNTVQEIQAKREKKRQHRIRRGIAVYDPAAALQKDPR